MSDSSKGPLEASSKSPIWNNQFSIQNLYKYSEFFKNTEKRKWKNIFISSITWNRSLPNVQNILSLFSLLFYNCAEVRQKTKVPLNLNIWIKEWRQKEMHILNNM